MKYVILNLLHKEKQLEKIESTQNNVDIESQDFEDSLYSDALYESETPQQSLIEDTGSIKQYTFSPSYMLTLKEARMSTEKKTPFAIIKAQDHKSKISEFDNIYATDKKIKYKDKKQGIRVGFIRGSDSLKHVRYDLKSTTKLSGIANEEIPIRKKKGFNQKRLGYIKLSENTMQEDYYVEVTKSRGILWMILTALIVIALVLLLHKIDWSDWQFNWDNLTAYKTSITELLEQDMMSIHHWSEYTLEGNQIVLELTSDQNEREQFKISIYAGQEETGIKLYESEKLQAGASIDTIELDEAAINSLKPGTYTCTIICDVYRNSGRHLGSVKNTFALKV